MQVAFANVSVWFVLLSLLLPLSGSPNTALVWDAGVRSMRSSAPLLAGDDEDSRSQHNSVTIEPHSALFLDFEHPHALDSFGVVHTTPSCAADSPLPTGTARRRRTTRTDVPHQRASAQNSVVQDYFMQQGGLGDRPSARSTKRCNLCNLRRATRGHFDINKQWTTLLCKVCVDVSGRRNTILLNLRCSECTRVAVFGPQHGTNHLVLHPSSLGLHNATILGLNLRSVPLHCKMHRAPGEVDVKHTRCNWPGHLAPATAPMGHQDPVESMTGADGGCHRQPNWGLVGGKPQRCSQHRAPTHVNLMAKMCEESACAKHAGYGSRTDGKIR